MTRRPDKRFVVIGLHPAVDRTIEAPSLASGELVRGRLILVEAAGKGANIAHTLGNFGHRVLATGFLGRWDKDYFLASFRGRRVTPRFVVVEGGTRQNVTLLDRRAGRETHITAGCLKVTRADVRSVFSIVKRSVRPADTVVFAGSLPDGFTLRDYVRAMSLCRRKGARVCVDAAGPALRQAVRQRPWAIKPNLRELEELTGRRLLGLKQTLAAARGLLDLCPHVLASMGSDGALLATREGAWHAHEAGRTSVVHSVGCGDALFAGFLSAEAAGKGHEESIRFAVACGSACVRSYFAQVRSRRDALRLLPRIRVAALQ